MVEGNASLKPDVTSFPRTEGDGRQWKRNTPRGQLTIRFAFAATAPGRYARYDVRAPAQVHLASLPGATACLRWQ